MVTVNMGLGTNNMPDLIMSLMDSSDVEFWWVFPNGLRNRAETTFTASHLEVAVPKLPWHHVEVPTQLRATVNGVDLAWFDLPVMPVRKWPWGGTIQWTFTYA